MKKILLTLFICLSLVSNVNALTPQTESIENKISRFESMLNDSRTTNDTKIVIKYQLKHLKAVYASISMRDKIVSAGGTKDEALKEASKAYKEALKEEINPIQIWYSSALIIMLLGILFIIKFERN